MRLHTVLHLHIFIIHSRGKIESYMPANQRRIPNASQSEKEKKNIFQSEKLIYRRGHVTSTCSQVSSFQTLGMFAKSASLRLFAKI
jgi:hypothetical protein